jgi:leucine-rich repeat protein SHOC2
LDSYPFTGYPSNTRTHTHRNNGLALFPDVICRLEELTTLDLSNNQLLHLPKEIGELRQLSRLYVAHNKLSTLPDSLGYVWRVSGLVHPTTSAVPYQAKS